MSIQSNYWIARNSAQFDKTSDTTLANVTGLTFDKGELQAGRIYEFEAILYTTSNVGGGVKFAVSGTATATAIIYEAIVFNGGSVTAQGRGTALDAAVGAVTTVNAALCRINGRITVNVAGTITIQFAQNASNGAASSVLVGSTFKLWQVG